MSTGINEAASATADMAALRQHRARQPLLHRRAVAAGGIGAAVMAAFYTAVVWGASGSFSHLADQVRTDWYLLVLIVAGFAVQVAFFTELRHLHHMHQVERAAGGAGAGASTVGMVACCSHHLADLIPLVGATGAAAFLYDTRVAFMVVGLVVNAVAVSVAYRRLRSARDMDQTCAA